MLRNDEPAEKCNGLINRSRTQQRNHGVPGQATLSGHLAGQRNQFSVGAAWDASRIRFTQSTQLGYLNPDRSITGLNAYGDGGLSGGTVDGEPYDTRVDLSGRTHTWSVFASNTVSIQQRLHLTLSGRYNRTRVSTRDRINPGGSSGSLDGEHAFSRFNPAIGLSLAPSRSFSAYVGYNEGSRTPTAVELGCADPAQPCKLPNAMAGEPPLKQVVTKTWEAGLRGALSRGSTWNASVFHAENSDDILFVADNQAATATSRTLARPAARG